MKLTEENADEMDCRLPATAVDERRLPAHLRERRAKRAAEASQRDTQGTTAQREACKRPS